MKIIGHLDRCSGGLLGGWAVDLDEPQRKLQLTVRSGDIALGACSAGAFRQDLADGGVADGFCAFKFELPAGVPAADLPRIKVYIEGTDYFFPFRVGGPVKGQTPGELYAKAATALRASRLYWRKFDMCLLHIGTEKTGSTSLQNWFGLNRRLLQDSGYFIPQSLTPAPENLVLNHSRVAMISMSDDRFDDDLRRDEGVINDVTLAQARQDIFIRLAEEVAAVPRTCHTIILTNEHCHSRLLAPEEVQNLKDFLDQFCETVRVVVYLRPQHEVAMSQYGMFLANGAYDIDMFPPLPPPAGYAKQVYTSRSYFDYASMMDRWAKVFGEDAIQPRIYSSAGLKGGDIVSDFIADLGLMNRPAMAAPRRNTNVTAHAQAFFVAFYRAFDRQDKAGSSRLRERIRNAVLARFPGSGTTPSRPQVRAFLDQFEEGNELIRQRWFPQSKVLFDVDLERYPEDVSPLCLDIEEIMALIVEVLLQDQELNFSLDGEDLRRLKEGLAIDLK